MKVGENLTCSIKPFYVYEENNCLYIKNVNEKVDKIANNIVAYCANFDDSNVIHICSIDTRGKLIHFIYKNGKVRRKSLCRVCHNTSNLKNMRLFIINNSLNVLLSEESSIKENLFRVSHYNFNTSNYNIHIHHINNIVKKDECIYKLSIDDMSNMILTYETEDKDNKSELCSKTLIFNTTNRKWLPTSNLLRSSTSFSSDYNCASTSTIKDDLFEFCYSISYKRNNNN